MLQHLCYKIKELLLRKICGSVIVGVKRLGLIDGFLANVFLATLALVIMLGMSQSFVIFLLCFLAVSQNYSISNSFY